MWDIQILIFAYVFCFSEPEALLNTRPADLLTLGFEGWGFGVFEPCTAFGGFRAAGFVV